MRRTIHRIARLLAVATALAVQGCAHSEPGPPPSAPPTAGGEAAVAQASPMQGNAPSAKMAVAPRPPAAPPVEPAAESSKPAAPTQTAAPVQYAQPAPATTVQPQAAPTYVTTPPPAPQREAYPTQSSEHWVWAPGYWYWHGSQYQWIGGTWIPARRGHVYVSARWVQRGPGWAFMPGGWALSMYDPILYPVYPYDSFYYGNYWQHQHRYRHQGAAWRGGRSDERRFVRPPGSLGVRRIDRGRGSSRVRVRAKR